MCTYAAHTAEILQARVDHHHGIYTVDFEGRVAAPPSTVYRLLTDHDRLSQLNSIVLESVLLPATNNSWKKRRVVLHVCILFFCRNMRLIEIIHENGEDEVVALVDPAGSDFRSGETVWRIAPAPAGYSRLHLRSTFEPVFRVPPVIGPWLIRHKIRKEMAVMMDRMELYAHPQRGR